MEADLKRLFSGNLDNVALANELESLSRRDREQFAALGDFWAPALYDRDPIFFETMLTRHLDKKQSEVIEKLLPRAEQNRHDSLFHSLYEKIITPERYNRDILELAGTDLPDQDFRAAVTRRLPYNAKLTDETAIALYRRGYRQELKPMLRREHGEFIKMRELIGQEQPRGALAWHLFREFATPTEWRQVVEKLLQEKSPQLPDLLEQLHLHHYPQLIDDEIRPVLIEEYGERILPYLERHDSWFIVQKLETLLSLSMSRSEHIQAVRRLLYTLYNVQVPIEHLRAIAEKLYVFDPRILEQVLPAFYSEKYQNLFQGLLVRTKHDGYFKLYMKLLNRTDNMESWNEGITDLIGAITSDDELSYILGDARHDAILTEANAVALYRRNATRFRRFISDHIGYKGLSYRIKRNNYPELLEIIRQAGDMELYWRLFRQLPKPDEFWQRELSNLLMQDIPAEQISEELELRHPIRSDNVKPDILLQFLDKYGEAILPYFERHLNWVTRSRLEKLLSLDIPRADLLHELDMMARRQPQEFSALADLWATRLYDIGPDFFESFLIRYLSEQHEYLIKSLLPRIEADGRDKLFKAVYSHIVRQNEWQAEMQALSVSNQADEKVLEAMQRREVRSMWLTDVTAVNLYRRNAALFREFLKEHAAYELTNLRQVALGAGDVDLVKSLKRSLPMYEEGAVEQVLQELLDEEVAPEELSEKLEQIRFRIRAAKAPLFLSLMEKYGRHLVPFVVKHGSYLVGENLGRETLLDWVRENGSEQDYWGVFLQVSHHKHWNQLIREWLSQNLAEGEMRLHLQQITPSNPHRSWLLDDEIAQELYERYPELKDFIESHIRYPTLNFFNLVLKHGDEAFLDKLTINHIRFRGHGNDKSIAGLEAAIIKRFAAFYEESPQKYIQHVAYLLSLIPPFTFRRAKDIDELPVVKYLFEQHHDVWRQSPDGIRELLESPNSFVQLAAIRILSNPDAAPRVIENLRLLRALLLSRLRISTKREILQCLQIAMQQETTYTAVILPVLENIISFTGKRAITEDVLVSYVQMKHQQQGVISDAG